MRKTTIGGQGVLEGVMMRGVKYMGIAVRRETGDIATMKKDVKSLTSKHKFLGLPVIRGVVSFVEMLVSGVRTITDAARLYDEKAAEEDYKPNKAEEFIAKKTGKDSMDVAMFFAVVIALLLAVGLFFILPNFLTGWISPHVQNPIAKNAIDGLIRLGIFLAYMIAISFMPDIKRLFAYHGAEHKVIHCYEHEQPMDVEHARTFTTRHPRCGTSYLLIVMLISIFLFSVLGWNENPFVRIGLRLAMLPVVAGVSYEILKVVARYENGLTRVLRKPGMALQAFTTREPDDSMLETALLAFFIAEDEMSEAEIEARRESFNRPVQREPLQKESEA